MTEFGSLALVDDGNGDDVHISLPGVRKGRRGGGLWVAWIICVDLNYDTSDASAQVT